VQKLILYFSASDFRRFKKYGSMTCHQTKIRRMVLPLQGTLSGQSVTTASIVSAQWRLYGTMQSGSSWWIRPQPEHLSRRIMSTRRSPSLSKNARGRRPRISSAPPQTGQTLVLLAITKRKTALFHKAVIICRHHRAPSPAHIILQHLAARNFGTPPSAVQGHPGSAVSG